jgi:hypothetical protein
MNWVVDILRNIIRVSKTSGDVSHVGKRRGAYRVFVGKSKAKKSLERPTHRWEDNIKSVIQEMG